MKRTVIVICLNCLGLITQAQQKTLATFGWEMGIPVFNDLISEPSFTGLFAEYRNFARPNISVGFGMGLNSFDEFCRANTYVRNDQSQAITANMMRLMYSVPITFNANYYLSHGVFSPFVGIGVGAQYSEQRTFFSNYKLKDISWGLALRPSVGAMLNITEDFGLYTSAVYSFTTNNNKSFNQHSLQSVCFQFGFFLSE